MTKDTIKEAFKLLRENGYIARMNFMCCQNCGFSAIETYVDNMKPDKRAHLKGAVFYHSQDEEYLKKKGECYLAYSSYKDGFTNEQVGSEISDALKSVGLNVVWDGKGETRILVKGEEV